MTQNANYEHLRTMMDIENYITYYAAEVYCANSDWPQNNIDFWRDRTPEGRWRWMLFDTDLGFAWQSSNGPSAASIARLVNSTSSTTELFRAVVRSPTGRNTFITRLADLMNTSFRTPRVLERINQFQAALAPEMAEHIERWRRPDNYAQWQSRIDILRDFAINRPSFLRNEVVSIFNLAGTWNLTIETDGLPEGAGVTLNTLDLSDAAFPWNGVYFQGVPVTLSVTAPEGFCVSIVTSNSEFFTDQAVLLPSGNTTATIIVTRSADFNQDGGIDGADVEAFFDAWENGADEGDFNQDGGIDGADVELFFQAWEQGC